MYKFGIKEISKEEALKMIRKYHYSNTLPKINKYFLGFFLGGELVGVVTLGWGTRPRHTIQRIFPSLDTKDYLEIGRMCMTEEMPRNSESQMLSQLVKWIRKNIPKLKVLFTWADGMLGKAQKKALRTSTLSLTLSFLGFTVMLCFFTLSGISTDHTYFERYQDAWDVMVTVKDTGIENLEHTEEIAKLQGVESSVVYQKAEALCVVPESDVSEEVAALGGLGAVAGGSVTAGDGIYLVQAPIVIMDDAGFREYCEQIGITPDTNGSIVLNRIWDSVNSNFRYKEYVPFVTKGADTIVLQNTGQTENTVELPVLAYTQETPVLREEYKNYSLVQIVSMSLWNEIAGQIGNVETDTYIRVLAKEGITLAELNELEETVSEIFVKDYTVESENRMQEKVTDDNTKKGAMMILGAFCVLLAVIGIANVFSNTLGFLRQRKREFAQYMSVGMTPESMRKMFCVEALVIAERPLLITLPLTVLFVGFMITASYLDPMEFLAKLPIVPIAAFILAIFGFVALAYYIGGKRVLKCSLADALRNDSIG